MTTPSGTGGMTAQEAIARVERVAKACYYSQAVDRPWEDCRAPEEWRRMARAALSAAGEPTIAAGEHVDRMRAALVQGAMWFEEYARLHAKKMTPEGNDKSVINSQRANTLRMAAMIGTPRDPATPAPTDATKKD